MDENLGLKWPVKSQKPPALENRQWFWLSLVGAVFVAMAILQLFSADDFYNIFRAEDLSAPKVWAVLVIVAELWAAASFFKLRLSDGFRMVSRFFAGAVALFWLVESMRILTQNSSHIVLKDNSYRRAGANFFGRFLYQTPGWWPVIEALIFLFVVLYMLELSRPNSAPSAKLRVIRKGR
jgi:hypothetical protein